MTEKQWQNRVEFLVEQQANFETNFVRIEGAFEKAEARFQKIEVALQRLINGQARAQRQLRAVVRAGEERFERVERETSELRQSMVDLRDVLSRFIEASADGKGKRGGKQTQ